MKNNQHEPIFFTPPSGDTGRPRRLYKGGGGGDGGAAKRKAEEDARVAAAVKHINQIFAVDPYEAKAVDRNAYMQEVPGTTNVGSFGTTAAKPVNVPTGFELITEQTKSPAIASAIGWNALNNTNQAKRYLFNKTGYDAAVAAAQAEATAKNATAMQDREKLYTKIGDDTTNNAMTDLTKDRTNTERELGFMLARAGLSGGSRDVDVNKDILDTFQQGVLRASNMGTQAANDARSADDKTRVNLINSIRAGLDDGSAMQQAYEGMRSNAQAAQDQANLASLAGFFDTLRQRQAAAAYNNGVTDTTEQYKSTPYSSSINGDRGRSSSY